LLIVHIPSSCQNEQRYALDTLLGGFLGLVFEVECYDGDSIEITRLGSTGRFPKLTIDASFFHQAQHAWLKPESMPILPLAMWKPLDEGIKANIVEPSVPVLYGKPGLVQNGKHLHLKLDIFGGAFFMLSRYEELITKDRDNHDRFPSAASVALKAGFLDRPIVNEYLEILWACLHKLWPDLKREERKFRKFISCDVDHPFNLKGRSFKSAVLRAGASLIKEKSPKLALFDILNYVFKKINIDYFDMDRNSIDWIMKVNDDAGNKVAFYFIPIQTDLNWEDPNDVRSDKISVLLKHISDSGHEIGFHPGYNTFRFYQNFQDSANALKEACMQKGIDICNLGGRQHFLRFDVGQTPTLWNENGFSYDSSLGYADMAGFRCGTCYEYNLYDLIGRSSLKLKERPLIIMEITVIAERYMGLGYSSKALKVFTYYESICRKYNGNLTILWHNSHLRYKSARNLYLSIL